MKINEQAKGFVYGILMMALSGMAAWALVRFFMILAGV